MHDLLKFDAKPCVVCTPPYIKKLEPDMFVLIKDALPNGYAVITTSIGWHEEHAPEEPQVEVSGYIGDTYTKLIYTVPYNTPTRIPLFSTSWVAFDPEAYVYVAVEYQADKSNTTENFKGFVEGTREEIQSLANKDPNSYYVMTDVEPLIKNWTEILPTIAGNTATFTGKIPSGASILKCLYTSSLDYSSEIKVKITSETENAIQYGFASPTPGTCPPTFTIENIGSYAEISNLVAEENSLASLPYNIQDIKTILLWDAPGFKFFVK